MQFDKDGAERVVLYQSRELRPAQHNNLVQEYKQFSITYALDKFRVYLMGIDRSLYIQTMNTYTRL